MMDASINRVVEINNLGTLSDDVLPEILPGDILLFTSDGGLLGKVITKLTESPYSHSAMVTEGMGLVHMGLDGIIDEKFEVSALPLMTEGERCITVMRYDPFHEDTAMIVDKTNEFVLSVKGYDVTALLAIAGIIIFGNFKKNRRWKNIANFVLLKTAKSLHIILRDSLYKDKSENVMMCSQLVVEIFYGCRPEFDLKFENALCQRACLKNDDEIRLVDFLDKANVTLTSEFFASYLKGCDDEIDFNYMTEEMDLALSEKTEDDFGLLEQEEIDFANTIRFILDAVDKIIGVYNMKIPPEAAFITPADLNKCTKNLKEVGHCYLRRLKASF